MILLIIILYALFASTFSLGKVLLHYTQPIFLVGIRMSIAGIVLLSYQYFSKQTQFRFDRNHWKYYIQIILFTTYLPYILRYSALRDMPSSKACLLYNLSPFMSYFFSYLICSEQVTPKKIVGLIIGFLGFIPLLFYSPNAPTFPGNSFFRLSMPELYIIGSVCCLSYGWLIIHELVKKHHYQPSMINGIGMTFGGILALITSFGLEAQTQVITEPYTFLGLLAIVILVSNLLCHNLYVNLLRHYSPTFLSFASFLSPLFAACYGWFFFHETISWPFCLTLLCVMTGLIVFYRDEMRQNIAIAT